MDNMTHDVVMNDIDEETDVHTEEDVMVGEPVMTQTDVDEEAEADAEEVVRVAESAVTPHKCALGNINADESVKDVPRSDSVNTEAMDTHSLSLSPPPSLPRPLSTLTLSLLAPFCQFWLTSKFQK